MIVKLSGQVVLDITEFRVQLLLDILYLGLNLTKALLDGLSDAIPLRVSVEVDCSLHDDDFNFSLNVQVVMNKLLKALLVELDATLDDGLDLSVHDALVGLAEYGDQEVERHQIEHKDKQIVQHPDEENHELRVDALVALLILSRPVVVSRHLQVTNRVPVGRNGTDSDRPEQRIVVVVGVVAAFFTQVHVTAVVEYGAQHLHDSAHQSGDNQLDHNEVSNVEQCFLE